MAKLKDFLILTVGTLLVAVGIYFFKFPNKFSMGGVSGISVILGAVVPHISAAMFVLVINILLLIVGFSFFGRAFGIKTAYCTLLLSFAVNAFEWIYPMNAPLSDQPLLELVYAVMLPAVGSAMLFYNGASTGGTDIVAMILRRYTSMDIGKATLASDVVIALLSGVVFGIKIGMFSVLGLVARALLVDNVIESLRLSKYFMIVTDFPHEIYTYINKELKRGATEWQGVGTYSNHERTIIMTVLNRTQAILLKRYVKQVDPHAFVVITSSSDIIGKGFREG